MVYTDGVVTIPQLNLMKDYLLAKYVTKKFLVRGNQELLSMSS